MLETLWTALKVGLFFSIIIGMHYTSTREVILLYGRLRLFLIGFAALLLGIAANVFLIGMQFLTIAFWQTRPSVDYLAIVFIAFGIGLIIQVARFSGKQ